MLQHPQPDKGRVIFIHGVNIRRNQNHLRRIAPAFRDAGFCVQLPYYGYISAFFLGIFNWIDNRIADSMTSFIQEGDILVGHSNGAALVYLISKRVKLRGAILINAALDTTDLVDAGFVHVYYNAGDVVARISNLIPFSVWGAMGGVGYQGDSTNVLNIDQGNPPDNLPKLDGHSDIFGAGKAGPWSRFMTELCIKALGIRPFNGVPTVSNGDNHD